jgi:CDP-2,3-bis-(O-geranylgeranyl)-sn-glycerol synthase
VRPGWAFLPALGGAIAHAPVLRFDLAPALRRPLDGGATLRGRRLLGDNKTVRGALVMAGGTIAATGLLHRLPSYRERLPAELRAAGPLRHGALLGAAVVLGELPNSVLKRQLGIGERAGSRVGPLLAIHDQADFVLGAWPLMRPAWRMSGRQVAEAFAVVAAAHIAVNLAGYALGARTSPL